MCKLIILLSTLSCVANVFSASLEAEKASEAVKMKVYQYSTSKWTSSDKETSLKDRVTADVNSYCQTSPASCGLLYWDAAMQFSAANIGITTADKNKNMEVIVYITFSAAANISSVSTTTYVVNKAATFAILTANKDSAETAIGLQVTHINDEYYGIKISKTENLIIIPIAFAVVIFLVVVVVAMHFWNKRRTRRMRHMRRKEKCLHSAKVTPQKAPCRNYNEQNGKWLQENTNDNCNDPKKENLSPNQTPAVAICLNEFTTTTHPDNVGSQLPPIPYDEAAAEKKKKKRKKKKKHRDEQHGAESESENTISNEHSYPSNEGDMQQSPMYM